MYFLGLFLKLLKYCLLVEDVLNSWRVVTNSKVCKQWCPGKYIWRSALGHDSICKVWCGSPSKPASGCQTGSRGGNTYTYSVKADEPAPGHQDQQCPNWGKVLLPSVPTYPLIYQVFKCGQSAPGGLMDHKFFNSYIFVPYHVTDFRVITRYIILDLEKIIIVKHTYVLQK